MIPFRFKTVSVFSSVSYYFAAIYAGFRSVWISSLAVLGYLVSAGEMKKEVTEQYPDPISSRTADDLPPRTRGLVFNDIDRCTGCGECVSACPTRCIRLENEPGVDPGKTWVAVFDVDFSKCVFCGLCVEACGPQSLVQTKQYEGAVYDLKEMVGAFGRGHVTEEQRKKWADLRAQADLDEAVT